MAPFTISILPNKAFPRIQQARIIGNSLGHDLTIAASGQKICRNSGGFIDGLGPCAGLILNTPKTNFAAHSAPELELSNVAASRIAKIIKNLRGDLKHSYDVIYAFLTGGISYDMNDKIAQNSTNLIESLYETLIKCGIQPTVIAEQYGKGIDSRISTYFTADSVTVWGKPFNNLNLSKNSTKKEIEEALSNRFDFVEISDEAPVEILEKFKSSTQRAVNNTTKKKF